MEVLSVSPSEILFKDVKAGSIFANNVVVTNNSAGKLDVTVRVPSAEKIEVSPPRFALSPDESTTLTLRLRLQRVPSKRKPDTVYKEFVFLKTEFMERRIMVSYTIEPPEEAGEGKPKRKGGAHPLSKSMDESNC